MQAKSIALILSMLLVIQGHSQNMLIGNWRRLDTTRQFQDTTNKQRKLGDLEIREDFTYHIEGDNPTKKSTIPGWHTGEEANGSWEQKDNKHITFWLEPKEQKIFLVYKIVKLSKERLVLRSAFDNRDNGWDITYFRL